MGSKQSPYTDAGRISPSSHRGPSPWDSPWMSRPKVGLQPALLLLHCRVAPCVCCVGQLVQAVKQREALGDVST